MITSAVLLFSTVIAVKVFTRISPEAFKRFKPLRRMVDRVSGHIRDCLRLVSDSKLIAVGILIISAEILVAIIRVCFCFKLIGLSPEFSKLAIFVAVSRASSVIIITPGNFGLREFLFGYLSDSMGIGISQGIFISLTIRSVEFILLGCLACLFLFLARLNGKRVARKTSRPI
jgi:uncharacterized membrane protein YbhN (UPF0104 family)